MLKHPPHPDAVIAALQTGYGKNHIMRIFVVLETDFILIFIPLLTACTETMVRATPHPMSGQ